MRNWMLAASAAALAITAPALAERGGHGGGHGGGKDRSAQVERGGGKVKGQADKGRGHAKSEANRGGGKARFSQNVDRGGDRGPNRGHNKAERDDHRSAKAVRVERRDDEGRGRGRDDVRVVRMDDDRRRDAVRVRDFDDDDGFVRRWGQHGFARGFVDGCPPGLAKKDNGCLPPGQAKKWVGTVLPTAFRTSSLTGPYRDWYRDDDRYLYRMGPDGLIYRVNRADNLIDALIPSYLNDYGYYPVGMAYPSPYNFYNVPVQYSSYWPDDDDYYYRYGNGAIYQVDPRTSMIRSIVALLAGDLAVGQRLPLGYNTYNVPLDYRAQYYDTPDAWYRYNDGYIYQVDPTTQLITAVIRALV